MVVRRPKCQARRSKYRRHREYHFATGLTTDRERIRHRAGQYIAGQHGEAESGQTVR